jgi:uncharacterized membrane protein YgcG
MVQVVVLTATVVAVACVAGASTKAIYPAPPPPGRIISDAAGLIDKEDGAEIERLGAALLAEKGYPVAVVTIRSLAGQGAEYPIDRYALELMQSWRHEERFRTYGMLLLVAAGDRKARIQLGSAWGGAHDDRARRIMDRMILPEFRDGDLSSGILAGVRGFDAMGRQVALPQVDGGCCLRPARPWSSSSSASSPSPGAAARAGRGRPRPSCWPSSSRASSAPRAAAAAIRAGARRASGRRRKSWRQATVDRSLERCNPGAAARRKRVRSIS